MHEKGRMSKRRVPRKRKAYTRTALGSRTFVTDQRVG